MEPQQSQNTKVLASIVVIVLLISLGYFLFTKYNSSVQKSSDSEAVVIENIQRIEGILPAPKGFPLGFPLEEGNVLESAIAKYPEQKAEQLSVSYLSLKTVSEKYQEYKDYMSKGDYTLIEDDLVAEKATISGVNDKSNLSVVINIYEGKTRVQIAYLLKYTQ